MILAFDLLWFLTGIPVGLVLLMVIELIAAIETNRPKHYHSPKTDAPPTSGLLANPDQER